MDFQFGDREEALRREIRDFVKQELPPGWLRNALGEESGDEEWAFTLSISKKLSEKGWLTMSWPDTEQVQLWPFQRTIRATSPSPKSTTFRFE